MTDPTPAAPVLDLRLRGWRQGSILPHELAVDLSVLMPLGEPLGADDHLVVISHDCDVCHDDIEKEPFAELIMVRQIPDEPAGERAFMRNPRVLEFEARVGADQRSFRVSASERCFVPRTRLVGITPAARLVTQPPDLLIAWLTNRYIRSAFPDAFNERVQSKRKDLAQLLKTPSDHLYAVYLKLDDYELPPETPYRVVVRGTMLDSHFAVPEHRFQAQRVFDGLVAALDACEGIEVVDDALVSEAEVSLDEVRVMKRWSVFDSLSLRVEEEAFPRIEPTR